MGTIQREVTEQMERVGKRERREGQRVEKELCKAMAQNKALMSELAELKGQQANHNNKAH